MTIEQTFYALAEAAYREARSYDTDEEGRARRLGRHLWNWLGGDVVLAWRSCEIDLPEARTTAFCLCDNHVIGLAHHHGGGVWTQIYTSGGKVTHWLPIPTYPAEPTEEC